MRPSRLLVFALVVVCVHYSTCFIEAPVERISVPETASTRRYWSDPVGRASALYTSLLQVGGQNYRLILDTGSGNTYIIAQGCTSKTSEGTTQGCSYSTNFYSGSGYLMTYDSLQCSSVLAVGGTEDVCGLSDTYADGATVSAVARFAPLHVGNYNGTTTFGAAYSASSDFIIAGADGIWGLRRPNPAYKFIQNSPLNALFDVGMAKVFAMCLSNTGGALHLGGYDSSFASGGLKWYTFNTSSADYQITSARMTVGTTTIPNSGGSIKFDTGSTMTLVPESVFSSLLDAIASQCSSCNMNVFFSPYYISVATTAYPSITISFADISGTTNTYTLTGAEYLSPNPATSGSYTSGFYTTAGNTEWVFGQSFMRNFYTVFDISYGVLGIGKLAGGKCTSTLSPIGSTSTLSPAAPKPPTSTGGLTSGVDAPSPRAPIAPTPDTVPNAPHVLIPTAQPKAPVSGSEENEPFIAVAMVALAVFGVLL